MRTKSKIQIPGIGMRIIKSAIGVFLCYLVNLLRANEGIVFYSQLAVLWCMQDYVSETKAKAAQRTIGTMVGAAWGLIVILFYAYLCKLIGKPSNLLYGFIVSVATILVLYTTVVMKRKQASYFSCVVLLSIVVNHISDANPYLFVFNRVLDTMIGIGIGVLVNCFTFPRSKNPDILFLTGLDDTLLASNGKMSDYSRVELNRLIEDGAKVSISTIRTPASLMGPLKGVDLKLPVIVMDGAALFNISEKKYEYTYVISPEKSIAVRNLLDNLGVSYFSNVIIDDLLIIYYQESENEAYRELVNRLRSSPYRNYIRRPLPDDESVVYFMVIDKCEKIKALHDDIIKKEVMKELKIVIHPSTEMEGYSLLKIYSHNATKENMTDYLREMIGVNRIITFGSIKNRYDYCIESGDFNRVVKLMKKEYEPISLFRG